VRTRTKTGCAENISAPTSRLSRHARTPSIANRQSSIENPLLRRATISTLLAATCALAAPEARAQEVGGYAGAYLRNAISAGDIAMGGAFVPFVSNGDGSAILGNSSALPRLENSTILFSHSSLPFAKEVNQQLQAFGYGMRVGPFLGFSVGVVSYGIGNVKQYNANEQLIPGQINSNDLAVSLGAGMAIGPANIGTTIRYLKFIPGNDDNAPSGYALDLSGTWEFEQVLTGRDWLAASVIVNNLAGEMTNVHDVLPVRLRAGGAYLYPLDPDRITSARIDPTGRMISRREKPRAYILGSIEAQFTQHDLTPATPVISAALEWAPLPQVPFGLRAGFNTRDDIAGGFFVSVAPPVDFARNIRLDAAARRDAGIGGVSYHVTLTAGF
jgi:hypothetical protein